MRKRKRTIPLFLFLALPVCGPVGGAHQPLAATLKRFEDIRDAPGRTIIKYDGELKEGLTYRATVRGDKVFHLMLVPQWKVPIHQAVGVDWTNLDEFPALKRLGRNRRQREIVFRVISDEITYLGARRWRRMVSCKIIAVV